MKFYSARQAAKKLGIPYPTLATYTKLGKVPAPENEFVGETTTHIWTEAEIEHVRHLLPKIANGRKTRYKKKQSALSSEQSAKAKGKTKNQGKDQKPSGWPRPPASPADAG